MWCILAGLGLGFLTDGILIAAGAYGLAPFSSRRWCCVRCRLVATTLLRWQPPAPRRQLRCAAGLEPPRWAQQPD